MFSIFSQALPVKLQPRGLARQGRGRARSHSSLLLGVSATGTLVLPSLGAGMQAQLSCFHMSSGDGGAGSGALPSISSFFCFVLALSKPRGGAFFNALFS